MNRIEVSCETTAASQWNEKADEICRRVLELMEIDDWELSVVLCSDATIRKLNDRYRGIDEPTDVLAFPQESALMSDGCQVVGDIVVSVDTMAPQARDNGQGLEEELRMLLVHGILHLDGMDHEDIDSKMMQKQDRILNQFKEAGKF